MEDDLLSVAEVAEQFDVTAAALGKWVRAGRLAALRGRGGWRFRRQEVIDAIESGQEESAGGFGGSSRLGGREW